MSWIIDDWRLKLLALGLAVLMLAAVAFYQNPPTTKTLPISLRYTQVGSAQNLVIINPPSTINVTFTGLADVVASATPSNFFATVNATNAAAGPAVKLSVTVTATNGVIITNPAPIVVRIETNQGLDLPLQAVTHAAPGWVVTNVVTNPGTVHFTGPSSWEDHLTASVVVAAPVAGTSTSLLNQPIQLQNSNGALYLTPCSTQPCASLDNISAALTISAKTGTTSTTVPLNVPSPSQPPPPGYEITGVTINPQLVTITGDPAVLAKIQRIILPANDLSSATSTAAFTENIPYPDGVTSLSGVAKVTVTYTIQRNPLVSPSPSP